MTLPEIRSKERCHQLVVRTIFKQYSKIVHGKRKHRFQERTQTRASREIATCFSVMRQVLSSLRLLRLLLLLMFHADNGHNHVEDESECGKESTVATAAAAKAFSLESAIAAERD